MNKVLILCATMGNWGETNGIVTAMRNLVPLFQDSGLGVDLITYGPSDNIEVRGNVKIITHRPRLPIRLDPNVLIDSTPWFSNTAAGARMSGYSIVNSWTPGPLGWLGVEIARKQEIPLISVYHTTLGDCTRLRTEEEVKKVLETPNELLSAIAGKTAMIAMEQWMKWYYNKSDLILAPSKYAAKEARSKFRPRVDILSRGVDTDRFSPSHRTRNDEKVKALYVGRLAPEKNLHMLVDVFQGRDITIVGHGPFEEELKQKLDADFRGKLLGKELSEVYANSDFFVFPSLTDTFGQVVQEAMASGLPVVVMDKMGPKEIVRHSVTGFVASSKREFEKYVEFLYENDQQRVKMGKAAREYALTQTWESVFNRLLSYFNQIK